MSYKALIASLEIAKRADVDSADISLRIDAILRQRWSEGAIAGRFKTLEQCLGAGRLVLDKSATMAIMAAEKLLEGEWLGEWTEAESEALSARSALLSFIKWMRAGGNDHNIQAMFFRMNLREANGAAAGRSIADATSRSARDVETLLAAAELLRRFESYAVTGRDRLAAGRQNVGDPVKSEFVLRMGEGWLGLTGKMPGGGSILSGNPFLRFAAAGWEDMGGNAPDGTAWAQAAVARMSKSLKVDPRYGRPNFWPDWAV